MFTSIKRLAKDSGLILLGTVIYFVLSVIGMIVAPLFGPFGEAVSPGITGVFTGSVFFFLSRRVGRLGQFTVVSLITMCVYSLMGGMYLPWFISVVVMSVLADWLASRGKQVPVWQVAIAAGMVNIGSVFGAVIPCWFFMQSYRDYWLAHNETVETMDKVIKYTSGLMGLVTTLVTFALSVIGVYIVYLIWLGCSKACALKRARVAQTSAVAESAVADGAVADGAAEESAVADGAVADDTAKRIAAPQIVRIPPDNAMPKIVRIKTTDTERPNPPEMPQETPDRLIIHPKHLDQ